VKSDQQLIEIEWEEHMVSKLAKFSYATGVGAATISMIYFLLGNSFTLYTGAGISRVMSLFDGGGRGQLGADVVIAGFAGELSNALSTWSFGEQIQLLTLALFLVSLVSIFLASLISALSRTD
jgi:hypothetical protein